MGIDVITSHRFLKWSGWSRRGLVKRRQDARIAPSAPVLEAIATPLPPNTFSNYVLLAILHFLKDLPSFVDCLEARGLIHENAFLVPVFYSRREYVQRALKQEGWRVSTADSYGPSFYRTIRLALAQALNQAEAGGRKLIVVEDGGYALPMILKEFTERLHLVAGVVEQTSNGCRRDRDAVAGYRTTYRGPVPIPIIPVGECPIKKAVESPLVADAILQSLERLLAQDHKGLRSKRMAVMGFGAVGSWVARIARTRDTLVSVGVFDPDYQKLLAAAIEGFDIPSFLLVDVNSDGRNPESCEPNALPPYIKARLSSGAPARWKGGWIWPNLEPDLPTFVSNYPLIVGASGHCSIGDKVIARLRHNTYLVSCSSKQMEVDVEALKAQAIAVDRVPDLGARYTLPDAKGGLRIITLLGNGFPINLWGEAESVPTEYIEFVWALMLHEMARIARGTIQQTGLCPPDSRAAKRVASLFLQHITQGIGHLPAARPV